MLKEQSLDSNFNTIKRERMNFVHKDLSYAVDIYDNVDNKEEKIYLLRFISKEGSTK